MTKNGKDSVRLDRLKLMYEQYDRELEDKERFALQVFLVLLTVMISSTISFKEDITAVFIVLSATLCVIAVFFLYYHYFVERKVIRKISNILKEIWKIYGRLEQSS